MRAAAEPELAAAFASLLAPDAPPALLALHRVARCALARYPEGAVLPDPDMMASVVAPVQGGGAAALVVSFAPEHALALIRAWGGAGDPATALACYREGALRLGRSVLAAWLPGASAGAARLEEDALVATLLATHAPPDTAVVTAELLVADEERAFSGAVTLLLEAKALAGLLEAAR